MDDSENRWMAKTMEKTMDVRRRMDGKDTRWRRQTSNGEDSGEDHLPHFFGEDHLPIVSSDGWRRRMDTEDVQMENSIRY